MGFDMKEKLDKNNPIVKWIDLLFNKYDLNDLVKEHIFCNGIKPKNEKEAKVEAQKKINKEIIDQWEKKKIADVKADPEKFFTEGDESKNSNNA